MGLLPFARGSQSAVEEFSGTAGCGRLPHILSAAADRSRESLSRHLRRARALSTFPGQHHPVPYGQADILNARVGLDETVKGDDGVIISILGIYHFAAP